MERDMTWKTLKKEYLIQRPWLTARRDVVELPDGRINNEYYVLEYPDWVNIIAITNDNKFVFVRQYRYALGKTVDELVAGVIEKGEKPLAAAKRELLEETGYAGGEWKEIMQLSGNASTTNNLTHCFIAKGVEKVAGQHLDATEDIQVEIFSEEEVLGILKRGELWQSLMAAPLWRYFAEKWANK